jgi:hypothetical protein
LAPDSPLEELEAHEHAHHASEASGNPLIARVTLTIAVLAVAAAVVASLETTEGDRTIIAKNDAVLDQNRATDEWNFFQAKSLKKNIYALAAEQGGAKASAYAKVAAKNEAAQADIQKQAERSEHRHGWLTIAATLLHMSIAIATLAIILGRPWPWIASLILAAAGVALAGWVYI